MSTEAQDQQARAPEEAVKTRGALESLLGEVETAFKPSASAKPLIENAVTTLAKTLLSGHAKISKEDEETLVKIEEIVADIDKRISKQMNLILHHSKFQQLESAWRGLWHLVSNTETDNQLKIRVMNISKDEVYKELKKATGASWDQTALFKKIYEEEFGTPGGQPYGMLVGDYQFDHSPPDVKILREMSKIAAAAHAPFITAADPKLFQMESWTELSNPRDISKIFDVTEYAAWRSFRESEDSRYIGLTMPRFLARLPYGQNTNPVEGFAFEEEVDGSNHAKYSWANSAYAMATNITRSFKRFGWCTRIRGTESGGIVDSLPTHTFPTDDGGVDMKCPTEIAITDRRDHELSKNGLLPLCHYKNTDYAVFFSGESIHKAQEYEDSWATSNAKLSARLPYLFATCRFAHYLKCIVRDKIGSFKERADMEKWLNEWIVNYVVEDDNASEDMKSKKPLRAAKVEVVANPEDPGYYKATFWLRPHFQLEGLTTSLRLVSDLGRLAKS